MKIESKNYKFKKIIFFLKKYPLIFFFNFINVKSIHWIKTEQLLKKNNIKYFKIYKTLILFQNSLFKNVQHLISSSVLCLLVKDLKKKQSFLKIKQITDFDCFHSNLLCIKVKNLLYYSYQIVDILSLKYIKYIFVLKLFIKFLLINSFLTNFLRVKNKNINNLTFLI